MGVSNDKLANSLVKNQSEPNAIYGCSKCDIHCECFVDRGAHRSLLLIFYDLRY